MRIPMCARERVFRVIKREEWGWWIGLALATKDRPCAGRGWEGGPSANPPDPKFPSKLEPHLDQS